MSSNREILPDTAIEIYVDNIRGLDWVGMEGLCLPIRLSEEGAHSHSHASVDIGVDLPGGPGGKKGIHMSRLYRLVDALSDQELTSQMLCQLLQDCVQTHEDCQSQVAEITLKFDLLAKGQSLVSDQQGGVASLSDTD